MQTAALCHVRYFMLAKYYEQVGDVEPGTPERLVLHRLATFYALSDVVVRVVAVVGWLCCLCGPLLLMWCGGGWLCCLWYNFYKCAVVVAVLLVV